MDILYWIIATVTLCVLGTNSQPQASWRWCHVCSGKYPDRECELYPKYVSKGPGQVNCSKPFCTTYVRYKPKRYLVTYLGDGKMVTPRPLTPPDYEVDSIARECEEHSRGNMCEMDADDMGITCYTTCGKNLCNDVTRKPTWKDFNRGRSPDEPLRGPADIEDLEEDYYAQEVEPSDVRLEEVDTGVRKTTVTRLETTMGADRDIHDGDQPQKPGPPSGKPGPPKYKTRGDKKLQDFMSSKESDSKGKEGEKMNQDKSVDKQKKMSGGKKPHSYGKSNTAGQNLEGGKASTAAGNFILLATSILIGVRL